MKYISFVDLLLGPIILFIILMISTFIKNKNIDEHPEYKYYMPGLALKLFGGISLVIIYTFYYGGGDTHQYYDDSVCYSKLMFTDFSSYLDIMLNGMSWRKLFYFTEDTGWPVYFRDSGTYNVVRIFNLIVTLSFRSFIISTLIVAWISFIGVWKMYKMFYTEYPELGKQMAIAVLFIPSVYFWGSGLMKDTITYSALGYYIYSFYFMLIKKQITFVNILTLLLSVIAIISIKPYILVALVPSSILWVFVKISGNVRGTMIKSLTVPFLVLLAVGFGFGVLKFLDSNLQSYSMDSILTKAVVTQRDLKSDYYQGNSFDIGEFDANLPSMLSKSHLALNAALFRPYIWEARNPVMFLSGLENLFFLILTLYVIFKLKFFRIFKYTSAQGLLLFSITFSLFMAFSVGISTSNFGSMVRYKIPLIPFYVASLYILVASEKAARLKRVSKKMTITNFNPVKK